MDQTHIPDFEGANSTAGTLDFTLTFTIDLIKQYSQIIYKTSAKEVGKTAHLATQPPQFGHNGGFSKVNLITSLISLQYLQNAGNPKFNGLNTVTDHERYMDQCKDWMEKNN